MEMHPWLPNLKYTEEMLKEIGVNDIMNLFSDVPQDLILKRKLNIPYDKPLSEYEISQRLNELKKKNLELKYPPFIGGGLCPHYIPEAVKFIMSRSEFYTAYTPYQPEISQGLLQAIYEYQSLMAELLEMEFVNASMYDWASAIAEAVLMAHRINRRKSVLLPSNMNPYHREVVKTWVYGKGIKINELPINSTSGQIDIEKLEQINTDDVSAIYIQQPNFYGIFEENIEYIVDFAKKKNIITIMGVSPLSLGLIKPPGEYGIDIAVGDGQEIGLPLNYGGPLMGIFAVRWDSQLVRQMPGRIVGLTKDEKGNRAFTLILQTREQFTRREKATSNITTNETLMAIGSAVYLSLLGKHGLRDLAEEIYVRSHYAKKKFEELGFKSPYSGEIFEEFVIQFPKNYNLIHSSLLNKGIHGGLQLNDYCALFCFTEVHTRVMIDELVKNIAEVV
ncbi:glycine dehydrogenase subunit 1 [Sulfolobus acidocaldarius SUSAZ]|nr:glycine dehydrogenase subunit 1 [Sulfolobus acidocaldarius SUSAZ]